MLFYSERGRQCAALRGELMGTSVSCTKKLVERDVAMNWPTEDPVLVKKSSIPHTHMHTKAQTHTTTHTSTQPHARAHMQTHADTHTCTRAHTQTHKHIHTQ